MIINFVCVFAFLLSGGTAGPIFDKVNSFIMVSFPFFLSVSRCSHNALRWISIFNGISKTAWLQLVRFHPHCWSSHHSMGYVSNWPDIKCCKWRGQPDQS